MTAMGFDWWRLVELLGVWAGAGASFFAALAALKIAARQDELRLKVSVTAGYTIGGDAPTTEIVWITVVNTARRQANVTALSWRFSPLTKVALLQKVDPPNQSLPFVLSDGAALTVTFPVEHTDRENWYRLIARHFTKFGLIRRLLELYFFRLEVSTSTGVSFICRPSKAFMEKLRAEIVNEMRER